MHAEAPLPRLTERGAAAALSVADDAPAIMDHPRHFPALSIASGMEDLQVPPSPPGDICPKALSRT
jgi:hypothetical protein